VGSKERPHASTCERFGLRCLALTQSLPPPQLTRGAVPALSPGTGEPGSSVAAPPEKSAVWFQVPHPLPTSFSSWAPPHPPPLDWSWSQATLEPVPPPLCCGLVVCLHPLLEFATPSPHNPRLSCFSFPLLHEAFLLLLLALCSARCLMGTTRTVFQLSAFPLPRC
jgi:hypothetical protein